MSRPEVGKGPWAENSRLSLSLSSTHKSSAGTVGKFKYLFKYVYWPLRVLAFILLLVFCLREYLHSQ